MRVGIYIASPGTKDEATRESNNTWVPLELLAGVEEYPIAADFTEAYCTNCLKTHRPRFTHAYYPIVRGEKEVSSWICRECAVRVGLIW